MINPRRTHRGWSRFTHLSFAPQDGIFAFKSLSDFRHCRVRFRSLNSKCGTQWITKRPVKQRPAGYPFGSASSGSPRSRVSLGYKWNKDWLGIPLVSLPTLRVQYFSGDSRSYWSTTPFWDIHYIVRFDRPLRKETFHIYTVGYGSLVRLRDCNLRPLWLYLVYQSTVYVVELQIVRRSPAKWPVKSLNYRPPWRHFAMERPYRSLDYRLLGDNLAVNAPPGDMWPKWQYNVHHLLLTEMEDQNVVKLGHP